MASTRPLFILSNRSPFSVVESDADGYVLRPAAGGLASALGPLLESGDISWIAAPNSAVERRAAATSHLHPNVHYVDVPEDLYHQYYDVIANSTLWFVHHGIYDRTAGRPFDATWHRAWDAYRAVNRRFATALARRAPNGAVVLVQDYHLALVGVFLSHDRPDLRVAHFSHTPFASPSELNVLPRAVVSELLRAMSMYRACGFHSPAWAEGFRACSEILIGEAPRTFVAPLGPDVEALGSMARSSACQAYEAALDSVALGRQLIVRVDRLDPAKNLVRGFQAFEELLESEPRWRGRVVFLALAVPSRESSPEYASYRREVESVVARINERWGNDDWTPVVLSVGDSLERSLAALKRYDVLLVNPVRDGLNLVAKEGPLLNERDGVLVLSPTAGAWQTMGNGAIEANPFDVFETRVALERALDMGARERAARAGMSRHGAALFGPATWLAAQLEALGVPPGGGRGASAPPGSASVPREEVSEAQYERVLG